MSGIIADFDEGSVAGTAKLYGHKFWSLCLELKRMGFSGESMCGDWYEQVQAMNS